MRKKKKWTSQNPVFSLNILNYYYIKIRAKKLISFWKTVGDVWHGAGTCGPLLQFSCWHVTAEMSPVFIALEASSLSGKLLSFVRLHSFLLLDFTLLVSPHFSPSFYSLRYLYSLLLTSHWQFSSVWFQQWSKGKETRPIPVSARGAPWDVHTGSRKMIDSISLFLNFAYCN